MDLERNSTCHRSYFGYAQALIIVIAPRDPDQLLRLVFRLAIFRHASLVSGTDRD